MKIFTKMLTVLLLYTVVMGVNSVYAQRASGEILGVVKDQSTQQFLPYAVVNVKGTSVYAVTDENGLFRLINLAPGDITLQITFVGYSPQEIAVSLTAGERKTLEINMSEPLVALGEVTITAQRMGQNAAINQRLNSDALVNVVSKDAIRELPDINAAEAIGRLPGISLTRSGGEGSKVILRGLDPKFASVSINGVQQPATDLGSNADRSVDLSNISPEMLSGIEIYKSPTADMDGDAIAGVVNLVIAKAPDLPKNQFRIYGGYNGLKNTFKDFKGSWDFSRRFLDKKLGVMAQANYDQKDRSAEGISISYQTPDNNKPEELFINDVTLTNREQMTKRYGVSAFVDYQFKNAGFYLNNIFNASPRTVYTQDQVFERTNRRLNTNQNLSDNSTVSINTSLGGNVNLPVMKIDWSLTRVQTHVNNNFDLTMNFYGDNMLQADAAGNTISDVNVFFNNRALNKDGVDEITTFRNTSFTPDTLKQVNYIGKVDVEMPFKMSDKISGFLKFGGKFQTENRRRSGQNYRDWPLDLYAETRALILANSSKELKTDAGSFPLLENFADPKGAKLMNGKYFMNAYVPESELRTWYDEQFALGERGKAVYTNNLEGQDTRYYESMERLMAAYVMLKLNYGKWLTFVPGLRYEYSNNDYTGLFTTIANFPSLTGYQRNQKSNQTYGELLPSLHLKVKPTDWMDLRLSTVKTLSRPNYMWMLPRVRYNANAYQVSKSNPNLKHATSWNYDASITIYTGKFGLMSFGGYMKQISNMFYQISGTLSAPQSVEIGLPAQPFQLSQDFININDSYVKGLEYEYNTHFNFLPSPFNRFLLGFNVTRLWSETAYWRFNGKEVILIVRDRPYLGMSPESSYDKKVDRMPSQVDWTSNAWLGFEWKGFATRVSLAYQGTRLNGIVVEQQSPAYNTYTGSTTRIDFTAKQRINKMISVLLNLNNLTNATDGGYRFNTNYPTSTNMYGFTAELGIQINL